MAKKTKQPDQKTIGIDTVELSIPIERKLQPNEFHFGATYQHKVKTSGDDDSPIKFQDDITINWSKNLQQYYLPEIHFVDYPCPTGERCYEYQIRRLSLPKLMYGNNVTEIPADDFEKVLDQLYRELTLLKLPIKITKKQLRNAKVRRVDYGKNLVFSDGTSMELLSEMLIKTPLRKRSKRGKTQYHEGELFRDSIKYRAFIIYDKLAEAKIKSKVPRTAFGSDTPKFDFSKVSPNKKIIRLEVQIQRTKQLKIELDRLGFPKEKISFADIFSSEIASAVISHYWEQTEQAIRRSSSVEIIDSVYMIHRFIQITTNGKGGACKAFGKLGFNIFADTCGFARVKALLAERLPSSSWSRAKASLFIEATNPDQFSCLDVITSELKNMRRLTTKEIESGY